MFVVEKPGIVQVEPWDEIVPVKGLVCVQDLSYPGEIFAFDNPGDALCEMFGMRSRKTAWYDPKPVIYVHTTDLKRNKEEPEDEEADEEDPRIA